MSGVCPPPPNSGFASRWTRVLGTLAALEEHILDALAPRMAEQVMDVFAAGDVKFVPQERVQQRVDGGEVVPRKLGLERVSDRTLEQTDVLPVPRVTEEHTVERIDDLPVPQVVKIGDVMQMTL